MKHCFCPTVRNRLGHGMPAAFCYCGAGRYRQQWEGALGRAVRIDILESVLVSDDVCQFRVQLPEDVWRGTRVVAWREGAFLTLPLSLNYALAADQSKQDAA